MTDIERVDEWMGRVKNRIRTRYEGQELTMDEIIVREIERLREAVTIKEIEQLEAELTDMQRRLNRLDDRP